MNIAIISGASSGIGRSFALLLDKVNLDEIWLIGRNEKNLTNLQGELSTVSRCFTLDIQTQEAFDIIKSNLSCEVVIKYLVCSAGVGYNGEFTSLSLDELDNVSDINCKALTYLNCLALPHMNKGSKIINISSGACFLPQPYFCTYAASKAYVTSFSRALREEIKKNGISVTAVCPGPVDTAFFSGLKDVKEYKRKFLVSPDFVAKKGLRDSEKGKAISTPTLSMKLVHLLSKILPTSLILKFYK